MLVYTIAFALSLVFDIDAHARRLRTHGFTVLPDAGLDGALVASAMSECTQSLAEDLAMVSKLGLDPVEHAYSFSEVCHRDRCRWDMRVKDAGSVASLTAAAVSTVKPIINRLHTIPLPPHSIQSGVIISRNGSDEQSFHMDASPGHRRLASLIPGHRLFNVFIPLVDIEEDGDGTQFWPGSHRARGQYHRFRQALRRSGSIEDDMEAMAEMRAPACPAGGIVLFDYRLFHRGLANAARERPVAYAVCSTGFAWDGMHNFPALSLHDACASMPVEQEALLQTQQLVQDSTPLWEDLWCRRSEL